VSGSGTSWAIRKSASRSRQITTPAPYHSVFTGRMPFLLPNQQRRCTEGICRLSGELLKNGWPDRHVVWDEDSSGLRDRILNGGPDPQGRTILEVVPPLKMLCNSKSAETAIYIVYNIHTHRQHLALAICGCCSFADIHFRLCENAVWNDKLCKSPHVYKGDDVWSHRATALISDAAVKFDTV